MGDVKVRDKKTGEEKILPRKVAEILKNKYSIIGEAAVKPQEAPKVQEIVVKNPVVAVADLQTSKKKDVVVESDGPVSPEKETLRAQYEEKFGKKPGGRMGVDSLKKALE